MNTTIQISPSHQVIPQGPHAAVIFYYGLFLVTWSIAETVVQAAIMKHLKVGPNDAVILTGKMQFNPRIQLLCALLKRDGNKHSEAMKLLNKTEGFFQRNTLVHGNVIVGVPGELTFIKYDGGASTKQSFTADGMRKHVQALSHRIESLQRLLEITDDDLQKIGDATLGMIK